MGRTAGVAVAVLAVFVLAGCSSGHKSSPPTTSSTDSTTTTTETASSTSTTSSSSTTIPPPTTTGSSSSVRITDFTVTPSSPISCNSPTEVELKWTGSRATSVVLSIDGSPFATYAGGAQDHLEPFACDGKAHTYLLTARAGSATATATLVVSSTTG